MSTPNSPNSPSEPNEPNDPGRPMSHDTRDAHDRYDSHDDQGLRLWLGAEPERLRIPGPAPVEAVLGRARTVRARRRRTVAATAAVLAAAGAATPVLATVRPWHSATGTGERITVDLPKTDPRTGTVFSGTDDGKKWRIHVAPGDCSLQVGPYCQPDGHEQGNLENQDVLSLGYGELTADNSTLYWIHPRADVARADVQLSDGEHLTLTPALIGTIRVALFELPRRVGITRIGAYGSGGQEIAYTIPYLGADNVAIATDTWYRPDQQPTQAVLSRLITGPVNGAAAGSANSAGGTVQVDIGPWGICYTVRQRILATTDTRCRPLPAVGAAPGDQPTGFTDEVPQNPLSWIALGGLAPDNVDHVDFAVGGSTYRVKAVHLGGHTFAVCFVDTDTVKGLDRAIRGRTLYDASDKVISYDPVPAK